MNPQKVRFYDEQQSRDISGLQRKLESQLLNSVVVGCLSDHQSEDRISELPVRLMVAVVLDSVRFATKAWVHARKRIDQLTSTRFTLLDLIMVRVIQSTGSTHLVMNSRPIWVLGPNVLPACMMIEEVFEVRD